MKKYIFTLPLLLSTLTALAKPRDIVHFLPVDYSRTECVAVGTNDWFAIDAQGLEPAVATPGAPALPYCNLRFAIPAGATVTEVSYDAEWKTISDDVLIMPIQQAYINTEQNVPITPVDESAYAVAAPAENLVNCGESRMSGIRLLELRAIPFRYANRRLEGATAFTVRVTVDVEDGGGAVRASGYARKLIDSVRATVVNPEDVSMLSGGRRLMSVQPDYILIAPNRYFSLWQNYVSSRQSDHPEIKMSAVNFNDVLAAYPVNTDDDTKGYYARNDAERLHAYIRTEAAKGTHYFVLAGAWYDATGRKKLTWSDGSALNAETAIPGIPSSASGGTSYIPSDVFYACCDIIGNKYPWDYNGNGYYADEDAGNIDLSPDVAVSRISFKMSKNSMAELVPAYLAKIRKAERADFAGRACYAASIESAGGTHPLAHELTVREEIEFATHAYNAFDARHPGSWADLEPWGMLAIKHRWNRFGGSRKTMLASDTDWDTALASKEETIAAIQARDWEYVFASAHGAMAGTAGFYTQTSLNMSGLMKVFAAIDPCLTGYPDWQKTKGSNETFPCNSECLIENIQGGATFVAANSREGFFINNLVKLRNLEEGDGYSLWLANLFAKSMAENRTTPGDAWLFMEQNFGNRIYRGQLRWAWAEQMAYGDGFIAPTRLNDQIWNNGFADTVAATNTVNAAGGATVALNDTYTALRFKVTGATNDRIALNGNGALRVTQGMETAAGEVEIAIDGGVDMDGLTFTGAQRGNLTFNGDKRFYLAKLANCDCLTLAGANALVDIRDLGNGGASHDFNSLVFAPGTLATRAGNVIRSDLEGALANHLPLTLNGFDLTLETSLAFSGSRAAKLADITNSRLTVAANPFYGSNAAGVWERFALPITLTDSTLTAASGKFAFENGFAIAVTGNCAINSASGGFITLNGTTTVNLAAGSVLTISAEMRNGNNGRIAFTGSGTVRVSGANSLAGMIEVGDGVTLELAKIPLMNVSSLNAANGAHITMPNSASGTYQLLPSVGSSLTVANPANCFNADVQVLENGLVFDASKVQTWNANTGSWTDDATVKPWLSAGVATAFSATKSALFPDVAGGDSDTVTVNVTGARATPSAAFINHACSYELNGDSGASLAFDSLNLGGNVHFAMPVNVSGSMQVMGGKTEIDATLNASDVVVYENAEIAVNNLAYSIDQIKYVRIYFLAQKNITDYPDIRVDEFSVDGGNLGGTVTGSGVSGIGYGNLGQLVNGSCKTTEYVDENTSATWIRATADQMAARQVYVTIALSQPRAMFSTYGFHIIKMLPSRTTSVTDPWGHGPSRWEIQVSADGMNYVTVSTASCGYWDSWLNGNRTAYSATLASVQPTMEVLSGGILSAQGAIDAKLKLNAGAVIQAQPNRQLRFADSAKVNIPDANEGRINVDCSKVELSSEPCNIVVNSGWTIANLGSFATIDPLAELRIVDGTLYAVKGDGLVGPYSRTLNGNANWNSGEWYWNNENSPARFNKNWSDSVTKWDAAIQLDLTCDSILRVDDVIYAGTVESTATNNIANYALTLTAANGGELHAAKFDLTRFTGRTTLDLDTFDATVIAGADTVLTHAGNGKLIIDEGMSATLRNGWNGEITGTGTLVYSFEDASTAINARPEFAGKFVLESGTLTTTANNNGWTLAGVQVELGAKGTVEINHSANAWQQNLDYSQLTGIGTVRYTACNGDYYIGLPKNNGTSWFGSDTLSIYSDAVIAVQCMGNVTRNLRNLEGAGQFRFDANGSASSGTMTFRTVQTRMTEWSGYLWQSNNNRAGKLVVAGEDEQPNRNKSLTISGNNNKNRPLEVEASGYVILTGTWNGSIVNNGIIELPVGVTEPTWTGSGRVIHADEVGHRSLRIMIR